MRIPTNAEDLPNLVTHRIIDALQTQLAGQRLLDTVDDGELRRALLALPEQTLRLVEQPRVFERDAHAVRERLQQAYVRVAERVLALRVDQTDQPSSLIAADQRHVHSRFFIRRPGEREASITRGDLLHLFVDDQCLAGADDMGGKASFGQWSASNRDPLSVLVGVRIMDELGLRVVDPDAHVCVAEDFANLVADRIVDPLDVELGGERRLHAVDDGKFGVALLRLFQQPLRFVEQACVFERGAERGGDRGKEPNFRLAERMLALEILDHDVAKQPIAADDRDCDHRPTRVCPGNGPF